MTQVLKTLLPVFTVIALGAFARNRKFITDSAVDGISSLVNNVLFPIMIFNAFFTASLNRRMIHVVGVVFLLHVAALLIGKYSQKFIGDQYGGVGRYLLATAEGGNILFPLYAAAVGVEHMSNAIMIDIAMMFIAFLVIPMMIQSETGGKTDFRSIVGSMLKSPMIIAFGFGAVLNLFGIYRWMSSSELGEIYDSVAALLTVPIVTLILFSIGYRFSLPRTTLTPLFKTMGLRMAVMAAGLFFILLVTPSLRSSEYLRAALTIQCACPPSFMMPTLLAPVIKTEEQRSFVSTFLSLYIAVTLVSYALIVIFLH